MFHLKSFEIHFNNSHKHRILLTFPPYINNTESCCRKDLANILYCAYPAIKALLNYLYCYCHSFKFYSEKYTIFTLFFKKFDYE